MRSRLRVLVSWLVATAIVVAAVYGGIRLSAHRLAGASSLSLGSAVLAARQVAVPAPGDGQVLSIRVHPAQTVAAGAPLAELRVFGTSPTGRLRTTRMTVTAPIAGVVASLPAPVGSAVSRGGTVVQMYDPNRQTFRASVDTATIGRLRQGMHARLTSPAVPGWIPAVVDHVVLPLDGGVLSSNGTPESTTTPTPGELTVVLRPRRPGSVRRFAPGLQFEAAVDTASAPRHAPELVRVVGS